MPSMISFSFSVRWSRLVIVTRMVARSTMTVVGDTAYHIEGSSTYDPPFMGIKQATTTVDARHAGPCKPGQQPGDVVTAGGKTINIRNLTQAGK